MINVAVGNIKVDMRFDVRKNHEEIISRSTANNHKHENREITSSGSFLLQQNEILNTFSGQLLHEPLSYLCQQSPQTLNKGNDVKIMGTCFKFRYSARMESDLQVIS